ncbi:MAG TPA: PSD1 and planctomycete cytochrome C domain-containing protein [Leadbetterella sp.]|nr:PSD1 and planctomycete cytochrome C domain-containing protein [Leadbetterella sp.]
MPFKILKRSFGGVFLLFYLTTNQTFAQETAQVAEGFDFGQLIGRLHIVLVHFPIAILLLASLLEIISFKKINSKYRPAIHLAVIIGGISAVFSAIFGYILAQNEEITGNTLDLHKWGGIATAALSLITLGLLWLIWKKQQNSKISIYRFSLFATSLAVIFTGHYGGSLTHGDDYFSFSNPMVDTEKSSLLSMNTDSLSNENQIKLVGEVRAIFAHNCYKCHSSNKQEGKLRLDQKEFVFAGGKHGKVIVRGEPENSELVRRIKLPRNHKEAMPTKGKALSENEIELISFWIEKGAPWPDGSLQPRLFRVAKMEPRKPTLPAPSGDISNPIDLWVNEYFKKHNIEWETKVDDRTFLRRVYLDIVGLLPTASQIIAFGKDKNPEKRAALVSQLLDQKEEYAQHWLTFWNDALRNDYTGPGYITNGRSNITDWLYTSIKNNKPYNQFAKELLSPNESSKGFVEGIQWRGAINASQRVEMQAAQNVGQVILGLNLKCASCHDSFISDWKLEEAYAFANIFAEERLEINRCDKPTGKFADTRLLWQNFGNIDSTASKAKKMEQMANLLVRPENGRMYRTVVNRIWKQMMGRGIVESPDEMDNEPWSQDLLDWLASNFVEKNYDIKELIYLIATSKIYQMPSEGVKSTNMLYDNTYTFKGMTRRRLSAEQFSDAVSQVITPIFTIKDLKYSGMKPNTLKPPFARASLVANNAFLTALGRPNREVVSTSRDSQASLLQALELTNGERLTNVLARGAKYWKEQFKTRDVIIRVLFSKALGRLPNKAEMTAAQSAMSENPTVEQIQDLFWAVLLLPEFQLIY